jgi:lipopolysaccharide-induced tumor necrosis factor-alpha factor
VSDFLFLVSNQKILLAILFTMEKPTVTQNNYNQPEQSQYPEHTTTQQDVHNQQHPPQYDNRDFSSPLAQPPLINNPTNPPPTHQPQGQKDGVFPPAQQQQQNYQSMPIQNLQSQSAPVVCPSCGVRAMTVTKAESGGMTHAIAAGVCFFACLGCIPYCISSLKDVHHQCGNCNMPLADYHRSGRTEVRCFQK